MIVRRVIGADGRSRAYVNGQLVPLQSLREFAEFLIEIHGQQEYQHLVKRGAQRELLDEQLERSGRSGGAVADCFGRYRACRREYDALLKAAEHREVRLELLRHQLAELKAEVGTPAAIEDLFVEQKRIAGRGRLDAAARAALGAVYDADDSAHDLLARAAAALRSAGETDPASRSPRPGWPRPPSSRRRPPMPCAASSMRSTSTPRARKRSNGMRRRSKPSRASTGCRYWNCPGNATAWNRRSASSRTPRSAAQELSDQLRQLEADYRGAAGRLSAARQRAAATMSRRITDLMQELGLAGGRFLVSARPEAAEFSAHGVDQIEFLVSANPGQPAKSLAKVASGGELSRISLAVQVAAAGAAAPLCRVFDEVDSGIGGGIAEIVGRQLRRLGERRPGALRDASGAGGLAGAHPIPRLETNRRQGHADRGDAARRRRSGG